MFSIVDSRRRLWSAVVAFATAAAILAFAVGTQQPANAAYPGGNGWAAYQEGNDIFVVSADGLTGPTNISSSASTNEADPSISPDGTMIAFSSNFGGTANIWIADFDPVTPKLIVYTNSTKVTTAGGSGEPSWSPDGSQIVFERSITQVISSGNATAIDATGASLTDTTTGTFQTDGVLGGDRVRNSTQLWSGTVASVGSETALTVNPPLGVVAWAIGDVYEITRTKRVIFKVTAVASGVEALLSADAVTPSYNDSNPVWSPLGTSIAFETDRPEDSSTNSNIYTMDTNGGTLNSITDSGSGAFDDHALRPAWSPDGLRIAFHSNEPNGVNGTNVWTVNAADGSSPFNVTGTATAGDDDRAAAYSPDGTMIVFQRKAQASMARNLAIIGIDGKGLKNLTTAAGVRSDNEPNWQPVLVGVGDAYAVDEAETLTIGAPGVLGNDKTLGAQTGTATASLVSGPAFASSFVLNANGSFTYVHDGSETLADSFTYRPVQGGVVGSVATVAITVNPVTDPLRHVTGLVDTASGKWYLYNESGVEESSFFFGNPGDYPFMGDWDGDGVETPGLYRQSDGFVYLTNTNAQSVADVAFFFGNPGDVPIAGDFNGNGFDTVSIYRPSSQTFFIINELGQDGGGLGAADFSYVFGDPGDKPFVGDFNGDGKETVGLHRESTGLVYYLNQHVQGNADNQFIFGDPGDRLIAGDWTGDGTFTPALFRPSSSTMFLKFTNSQGIADAQFIPAPANANWLPVSGNR